MDIFKEIEELKKNNIKAALAIVITTRGSTPGKISSKMLILADGKTIGTIGGGKIEKDIIDKSPMIISKGTPQIFEYTLDESYNYMCGGYMAIYVEPVKPAKRVIIFGAGHVGQALSKILKLMDYYIIVVDDRKEFGNSKNFPDANEIIVDEFMNAIDKLTIAEYTFIVIVTRDHKWDMEITKKVIKSSAKYIGVIGSKNKAQYMLKELKNSGIDEENLPRLYLPIGVPIKSETPMEIGISIAAQIIDICNKSI